MYKSKRSLKVYEAPLGLNGKQQNQNMGRTNKTLGKLVSYLAVWKK